MAVTIPPVTPIDSASAVSPVNYYQLFLNGQRSFNPVPPAFIPGDQASNQTVDFLQLALDGTLDENLDKIPQSDFLKALQNAANNNNPTPPLTAALNNSLIATPSEVSDQSFPAPSDQPVPPATANETPLSVEDVITAQSTPAEVTVPLINPNSFNIYAYIINALQGGANEATPFVDTDNRVEFEA